MAAIKTFDQLEVWQKSRELSHAIYDRIIVGSLSKDFPLRDQMNGSSGSVPDNIAEGFGRGGNRELIQFLSFSRGSLTELQSQLIRATDRKHLSQFEFDKFNSQAMTVGKMISSFMHYLSQSSFKGPKFK